MALFSQIPSPAQTRKLILRSGKEGHEFMEHHFFLAVVSQGQTRKVVLLPLLDLDFTFLVI